MAKTLAINYEQVTDEALLVEDLGFTSLDRFELLMDLEAELGIEIREDDLSSAYTVGDVVRCINAQSVRH